MNKKLIIVFITISVLFAGIGTKAPPTAKAMNSSPSTTLENEKSPDIKFIAPKGSTQELYQDVMLTLLEPYINNEINNYYKKYLKLLPGFDFRHITVQSVIRPNGNRTSEFLITLLLKPYIGPHIVVGSDEITLRVKAGSTPKVENFEHVASNPLPPHYQDIAIEWPPK